MSISPTRAPIAALLALALAVCGGACGRSETNATSAAARNAATSAPGEPATGGRDRDDDLDHNDDDESVLGFGHAADAADRRDLLALVTRYFAAAAASDGAAGCRLLTPPIAGSVVERDGGSPGLSGGTCAIVLSKLFAQHHASLVLKQRTLRVVGVRVQGDRALTVLEFPAMPEKIRQIDEHRSGASWKLLELLDSIVE